MEISYKQNNSFFQLDFDIVFAKSSLASYGPATITFPGLRHK